MKFAFGEFHLWYQWPVHGGLLREGKAQGTLGCTLPQRGLGLHCPLAPLRVWQRLGQ